eukprot:m.500686 g.500686  ORF g.500686 m.500686 type:complete len:70 (-) comp21835_c0_seq8:1024-1233(-)
MLATAMSNASTMPAKIPADAHAQPGEVSRHTRLLLCTNHPHVGVANSAFISFKLQEHSCRSSIHVNRFL